MLFPNAKMSMSFPPVVSLCRYTYHAWEKGGLTYWLVFFMWFTYVSNGTFPLHRTVL